MENNESYMARALQLAKRGLFTTDPNPRVGCVIVKAGRIIAEGWHQQAGEAHAEINALANASETVGGADCYVTLEPCSHHGRTGPCATTLVTSGIKRVYIAMQDPNPKVAGQGIALLQAHNIEVHIGLLGEQAERLNQGFNHRMRMKRPYIRSKIAMSLDGRTAMASGESKWITGAEARRDVQQLRGQSSAILTGINTILADDPALTVREQAEWYPNDIAVRQPLRVVVDSQLKIPSTAKILQQEGKTLIASLVPAPDNSALNVVQLPAKNKQVDLQALMANLADREVNNVMVEAGAVLNGALLNAQLIDEIVIYMAAKIMGNKAKGLFHLPTLDAMAQNIDLTITDIRAVGEDWRITAQPNYNGV